VNVNKPNKKTRKRVGEPDATMEAFKALTQAEIDAAEQLLKRALQPRAIPLYSTQERVVLAILAANYSQLQRARGKRSKGVAKERAEYRRNHVNLLLRYVVGKNTVRSRRRSRRS